MKKSLALLLTALLVLGTLPVVPAYAWDKPPFVSNAVNRLEVLPISQQTELQPYQDYMSPFTFDTTKYAAGKVNGKLPAMGFNTWNAFRNNINEELIQGIADSFVRLGLDKVGYEYVCIDDGCYARDGSREPDGNMKADPVLFPSGFAAIADYIHAHGLKLGMYTDTGNLTCNGVNTGTWGHEDMDALQFAKWGVDYVKYDNCNNPWNMTPNLGAPTVRSIKVSRPGISDIVLNAVNDGVISPGSLSYPNQTGTSVTKNTSGNYVSGILTNTTANGTTGDLSFTVTVTDAGTYNLSVECAAASATTNRWLQADVNGVRVIDGLQPVTGNANTYLYNDPTEVRLNAGVNTVRLYCEKRREVALTQYHALFDGFQKAKEITGRDIVYSICEGGEMQPWLWGWKIGNSWRSTTDITGGTESGSWSGLTGNYNYNVILDEYAGLDKGWNDPDMLMVGAINTGTSIPSTPTRPGDSRNRFSFNENESHFNLWCMQNSPLLLGYDLRNEVVGSDVWQIITNKDAIALNQDPLGVQAKRVKIGAYSSSTMTGNPTNPDPRVYTNNNNRIDYLAKPCANGDIAVIMVNLSGSTSATTASITIRDIVNGESQWNNGIAAKMVNASEFASAPLYMVTDIGAKSKSSFIATANQPLTAALLGHASKTYRVSPIIKTKISLHLADSNFVTNYAIFNTSDEVLSALLIMAAYDETGKLRTVSDTTITVSPQSEVTDSVIEAANPQFMWTYKAFLWDAKTYVPLAESAIYNAPGANKTDLALAIRAANAYNLSPYSRLSAEMLTDALAKANDVYNALNPTQSEVDKAAASLRAAVNGLTIDMSIYSKITGTLYGATGTYGGGRTYHMLFDGNINTYYDAATAGTGYGGYDMGAGNATNVDLIMFHPRIAGDQDMRDRANGCTFRGSNTDDSGGNVGTLLYTISGVTGIQWYAAIPYDTTTEFRYIWFQSGASSWGSMAEVEFYKKTGVDRSFLDELIAFVGTLSESNYSAESWAAIQSTLFDAVSLPADANQAQIDSAASNLKAALAGAGAAYTPPADRTALRTAINTATATNFDVYSRVSVYRVTSSLAAAQTVDSEGYPSQESVDAATNALNTALNQLSTDMSLYTLLNGSPGSTYYGAAGSYNNNGNTYMKLFDGIAGSGNHYDATTAGGGYGGIDLGAGNEKTIDLFRFYPRVDTLDSGRSNGCTFRSSMTDSQGGNVGTVLHTIAGVGTTSAAARWYVVASGNTTEKFRFVWFQSGPSSWGNMSEVEFYSKTSVDKSLLDDRIDFAATLVASDYTATSWGELQSALLNAASLPADATQAQVDTAANVLIAALAQL